MLAPIALPRTQERRNPFFYKTVNRRRTVSKQHIKMHAQMKAHHEQMQSQMGKMQQSEKKEPEGHEAHHQGE